MSQKNWRPSVTDFARSQTHNDVLGVAYDQRRFGTGAFDRHRRELLFAGEPRPQPALFLRVPENDQRVFAARTRDFAQGE